MTLLAWSARDHPRIRGEHGPHRLIHALDAGSSPHTRGARVQRLQGRRLEGIIPAYAGSTRGPGKAVAPGGDHPRIRGEHMNDDVRFNVDGGSSPHTRGARSTTLPDPNRKGIIPAYAGSTYR